MDFGRARYRQAHRLPPQRWETALFLFMLALTLFLLASALPPA